MALAERSRAFLDWLDGFMGGLRPLALTDVIRDAGGPDRVALVSVDLICGFAKEGPLASPRVDGVIGPAVRLLERAAVAGVRSVCLVQDAHPEGAPEFDQFGPHCIRGTREAEPVPELAQAIARLGLEAAVVEKNSISSGAAPGFWAWHDRQVERGVNTFLVVGDCTDLCVYNWVLPVKTRANQEMRRVRIIVPENCVQTYDLPVAAAERLGVLPHDGDLLHAVFLYSMALNGIEVVKEIV